MSVINGPPPETLIEQMPASLEGISFVPERLFPYEPQAINTSASLYDKQDVKEFLGITGTVPVVIEAADKRLLVVDIREHAADSGGRRGLDIGGKRYSLAADFLLISPDDWDKDGVDKGFKGIRLGDQVIFGRSQDKVKDRFDFSSKEVSREHFSISYQLDGSLVVQDLDSHNHTFITQSDHSIHAEQTAKARDRVAETGRYKEPDEASPYGYLDNDPIIGRRSPRIEGGVYLGGGPREAITVKPKEDPRIDAVYAKMTRHRVLRQAVKRAIGINETPIEQLQTVYDAVQSVMKYDGPAVQALSDKFYGDQKVSLGDYIEMGIGVCRHQGLLSAYLIERLIADGRLKGKVRVERNTIPEYGGAHAWATYIDPSGKEFVIDAAQNFVGTKAQARAQAKAWDYYLPVH